MFSSRAKSAILKEVITDFLRYSIFKIDFQAKLIYSKEVVTEYRSVFGKSVLALPKNFFCGYQYRKTFSVIYAEPINRITGFHMREGVV
jgi:hypothetical protein